MVGGFPPYPRDPTGADVLLALGETRGQAIKAADPVPDVDPRPTPVAQAVCMKAEAPPDSTPVEIDQRIDRLLAENLALLVERKQLREIADARSNRCSELLAEARLAKALARRYLSVDPELENPQFARDALAEWAAKTL